MFWGRFLYRIRKYFKIFWFLFKDSRTPKISKIIVLAAIAYLVWPFDLIPDIIPFAGFLDEIIIIPILFYLATKFIPKEVVEENIRKVNKKNEKTQNSDEVIEGEVIN